MRLLAPALALLALVLLALVPLAAAAADGDPKRGAVIYDRCVACHSLERDRTGPRHCGVVGRRAGSVPGFAYSPAMRRSGLTWTAAQLDRFLADPLAVVPGTTMGYDGIKDERERRDLIAFLAAAAKDASLCP